MTLRITLTYKGSETVGEFETDRVLIGRLTRADGPGLDLSADPCVSRQHAAIEVKNGAAWLSDLGSTYGTQVNGREIRGQGEWRLWPEDTIVTGETTLRVEIHSGAGEAAAASASAPAPAKAAVRIARMVDTGGPLFPGSAAATSPAERRLGLLLDLPAQFGAQKDLDALLQQIMDRVVSVIPHAHRGVLLLRDAKHDVLLLKAYVSADEPAVSETLARRAMTEQRGFLWHSSGSGDTSRSSRQHQILHGMYAPLEWQGQVFGVICVDSPVAADSFQEEDLKFLLAIGHYAAMALSEQERRADLERSQRLVERLLANFSSKVRATLIEQARHGKLRPGGVKSEVTILFCDIVGFTKKSANMDAHDVVEMLNDYLQPVVDIVLRHDGTVDKFIGDAALAVFGSPEPHPEQHHEAVRAAMSLASFGWGCIVARCSTDSSARWTVSNLRSSEIP
jgi:adenylate cyclase